jgi:hypothetical protein
MGGLGDHHHRGDSGGGDDLPPPDLRLTVDNWWVIHGDDILWALREVANGGDPDLVMLELEANAQHEEHP